MHHHTLAPHVQYCREEVRAGRATCRQLAEKFGVTEKAVQACVYGHTYGHIPGALRSPKKPGKRKRSQPLSPAEIEQIRKEYLEGERPVREIAEQFGITPSYVVRLGRERKGPDGAPLPRRPQRTSRRPPAVRRGERHPQARLDALSVVGIRHLVERGISPTVVAEIFDTTPENISMIASRRRWKHVPDMALTPTAMKYLPPAAVELLENLLPKAS
ncbi:MAG TPA: hypothetical protein VF192_00505 [Longimicrobiales bacterium]